jgi:hypothetical protein
VDTAHDAETEEGGMASSDERPEEQRKHPAPEPACDVGALDDLTCEAAGVTSRADYTKSKEADLQRRRTAFDGARTGYGSARTAASADVAELRHRLAQLREQLRCRLAGEVIECLERAWEEVQEELRACGMVEPGCCLPQAEQCEFDTDFDGRSDQELQARKAGWERRVQAAEECFDALVLEPAALTKRVADLKLEVDGLSAEAADPKTTDVKHAYARLLWDQRRLDDIWLGFRHANDYIDCICRSLTCSVRGNQAIAVLVGEQAVRACREAAVTARCDLLRTHVVDEILAVYLKVCPPSYGNGGEGGGYGQGGQGGGQGGGYQGGQGQGGYQGGQGQGGQGQGGYQGGQGQGGQGQGGQGGQGQGGQGGGGRYERPSSA